jgi:hypothetical protein
MAEVYKIPPFDVVVESREATANQRTVEVQEGVQQRRARVVVIVATGCGWLVTCSFMSLDVRFRRVVGGRRRGRVSME